MPLEPRIEVADVTAADVLALQAAHLAFSAEHSPPEDVHALGPTGLVDPALTLFAARDDSGRLLGIGALRDLGDGHGELKSMHTVAASRGAGIGRALLRHLLEVARSRGYERVSLETGTMEAFAPARRLYDAAGFVACPPYSDYRCSPFSTCLTLPLI